MEGEEKQIMIEHLANHMKKSYLQWNKDAVEDEKILHGFGRNFGRKTKSPGKICN